MIDAQPTTTVQDYTKFAAIGFVALDRTRLIRTVNSIRREQLGASGMQRQMAGYDLAGQVPQPMLP